MTFIKRWFEGETATGTENQNTNTNTAPALADDFDFSTVLPDDLKSDPSLAKFGSHKGKAWVEQMVRSNISAQKMIGSDPKELVRVPVDPTKITAEDRSNFLKRIGLPSDEKAYELKANDKTPKGLEPTGELGKWFSKTAREAGIFPDQAQKLYEGFSAQMAGAAEMQAAQFAALDKRNIETLQKEFGPAFDETVKAATYGAQKLGGDEFVKLVSDAGLGTDPVFVKAMAKYGKSVAESTSGGDKNVFNSGSKSVSEMHAKATDLLREAMNVMDTDPAKSRQLNAQAQELFALAAK